MESYTYEAVHKRLRETRGPASAHPCTICGKPAQQWAYDHRDPRPRTTLMTDRTVVHKHAVIDGQHATEYSVQLHHYEPLCIACHTRLDRLMSSFRTFRRNYPRKRRATMVELIWSHLMKRATGRPVFPIG